MRLYLISSLAGAMEPCGCVKDMLGGVDHFAALVAGESASAPRSVVLGAGPMLFMDPVLDAKRRVQDEWKARAIADVLEGTGFVGWAPGANDWAGGSALLGEIVRGKSALVAANLEGKPGFEPGRVLTSGGERVGIAGASVPRMGKEAPADVRVGDVRTALERSAKWLKEQGARIRVGVVAMPRGEALRLAESVRGFHVLLVGKSVDRGETNDSPTPPVLVGETLVVEAPNHLQSVAVVDLFVRDGRYSFADGSGIADEEERTTLKGRIAELETRLSGKSGGSADLEARRADLARLKSKLLLLSKPSATPAGSFFRYKLVEIRESLGSSPAAAARLAEYYQRVNEHNREAFKDVLPPPVPEGGSGYLGVAKCTSCHQEERAFWDKTSHAKAYPTLANQHKQFNLECVGCHVTGYEEPGGSTVAHVANLEGVQCETCHGPGSRHLENPTDKALITRMPETGLCAAKCHHPPHVKPNWSVSEAWKRIIGPGHGG